MINPYITFEVSNRKDEVIAAMKNIGWADYWTHQGNHYDLPECCLWKDVSKIAYKDEAVVVFAGFIAELKGVIKKINIETASPDNEIKLLKCMVVPSSPFWAGIKNENKFKELSEVAKLESRIADLEAQLRRRAELT